jgi:hypothetical protein
MTTNAKDRVLIARQNWINSDPKNPESVRIAWQAYQQALTNYKNEKGV